MSLRYCFEESKVLRTLSASRKNDLAVIDTDGISTAAVKAACARGVWVYGYINAGSLERERSYYSRFKHLRIAKYEGWDGEYWIDPTADEWKEHIVALAKTIKATGAIGVYLDNTDIYYMCGHGFKNPMKKAPPVEAVYHALEDIVDTIQTDIGLIVMPNGGDTFVRRFITEHPGIIRTINQEGLFYEDFKKQTKSETEYRKAYMKWAAKHISGKVRGIEYCKKPAEIAYVKAYYAAHGWDVYISKHKNLEGD
jgi:uncharacterized protein (TIGR01370 family)